MSSVFKWGTVTGVGPLRVRLDGDTVALPFTPDSLVDPSVLRVGDRVRCELSARRAIVVGRSQRSRPVRQTFTPEWSAASGFTLGNGTVQAGYSVSDGELAGHVTVLLGTTTSWSGILSFVPPVPPTSTAISSTVALFDASAGASGRFVGELLYTNLGANLIIEAYTNATGFLRMTHVNSMTVPHPWAVSDEMRLTFSYPV